MAVPTDLYKYFKNLDWDRLKSFYFVAKENNISTAAKLLNMTMSPLSRQISTLEKQLGHLLFTRNTKGVELTRKGQELFIIVEEIFLKMRAFSRDNFSKEKKDKRKVRIATTHAMAVYIVDDILADYQEQHPHIVFELISNDKLIDIIVNDVDIAIRPYYDDEIKAQGIEQEYLFSLKKSLYASKEYLEKYGEPKTVEQIKSHFLIASANSQDYPYSDTNWILTLGMPKGKLNNYYFSSNSIECQINKAIRGKGIVSSYKEFSIIRNSNLINILPEARGREIQDYVVYPSYLKKDVDILEIKEFLKSKLTNLNKGRKD